MTKNKLSYYRKLNHYSQKDIANYLLITQPNYSNIETGKVKLNFDYAILLADLYKIPLSYLIDKKEGIEISSSDLKILIEAKNIIEKLERIFKNEK